MTLRYLAPDTVLQLLEAPRVGMDEARRLLGAPSETETVRLALERVVRNRHFADRIRSLGASGCE